MAEINVLPEHTAMRERLLSAAHEFLLNPEGKTARGDLDLSHGVRIDKEPDSEMVLVAQQDLKCFLRDALGVREDENAVTLSLRYDRKTGGKRDYEIDISDRGIQISAFTEWGTARALYRLQSHLKLNRIPALRKEKLTHAGSLDPALCHCAFKGRSTHDFSVSDIGSEGYLLKLSRSGYTGFHLNLNFNIFSSGALFPELNHPDADRNRKELSKIVAAAKRCGLDVYLTPYLEYYPAEHSLFQRVPEARGGRVVLNTELHALCSSSRKVNAYYQEQMARLFSEVPGLGGVLLICGCEGWLHCHTVCERDAEGKCGCRACAKMEPEKSVAEMFNGIARTIRRTSPDGRCIIWNYGLFAWSDPRSERFISLLGPECEVMMNFDTGDDFRCFGAKGTRFDYSLSAVGPSADFLVQKHTAEHRKLTFHAKCENASPLEFCSVQFVPAMTRWLRKYERIRSSGAGGALFNWKFIGYTEALSAELAGMISFGEDAGVLKKLARRDFGTVNAVIVMKAWRCFDKAMEHHPFSIGTAGYFKGPLFIGFSHPLILNPTELLKYPGEFVTPDGRCFVIPDLSFVQPFGVNACRDAFHAQERAWEQGCCLLDSIVDRSGDPWIERHLKEHRALCRVILCMLRTAIHMIEFYRLRDSLFQNPVSPAQAEGILVEMRDIAGQELVNTEAGVESLKQNPGIFFSLCYRYGVSMSMCEFKLRHTEDLICKRLPALFYSVTFSRNRPPRWLPRGKASKMKS